MTVKGLEPEIERLMEKHRAFERRRVHELSRAKDTAASSSERRTFSCEREGDAWAGAECAAVEEDKASEAREVAHELDRALGRQREHLREAAREKAASEVCV